MFKLLVVTYLVGLSFALPMELGFNSRADGAGHDGGSFGLDGDHKGGVQLDGRQHLTKEHRLPVHRLDGDSERYNGNLGGGNEHSIDDDREYQAEHHGGHQGRYNNLGELDRHYHGDWESDEHDFHQEGQEGGLGGLLGRPLGLVNGVVSEGVGLGKGLASAGMGLLQKDIDFKLGLVNKLTGSLSGLVGGGANGNENCPVQQALGQAQQGIDGALNGANHALRQTENEAEGAVRGRHSGGAGSFNLNF